MSTAFKPIEYVGDLGADDQVFYVDRASPPGGDGSIEQPYRRIQDAIDASNGQRAAVSLRPGSTMSLLELMGQQSSLGPVLRRPVSWQLRGGRYGHQGLNAALLGWVTVRGAGGLNIENWRDVFLFHVRSQTTTEHGLA